MHDTRLLTVLLVSFLFSATASAQVFDSGPSDPALFTNVIDLPGDVLPDPHPTTRVITIGGSGETNQINVADGGDLGNYFRILEGSELNISGGAIGAWVSSFDGSEVNISGGSVGRLFAHNGSAVSISGGSVGNSFVAYEGSDVELVGGEFKLNGEAFTGPIITLGGNDVFTGTLADGSAFISTGAISGVSLTPSSEPLPAASPIPIVVAAPVGSGPHGLRKGQSLTLQAGGELGRNFAVVEATLNVEGGTLERNLTVAGGIVSISGGTVVGDFNAFDGSEVNISGGAVESTYASGGSVVNISGGEVSNYCELEDCVVNISGGEVESYSEAINCEINISGGYVGEKFNAGGSVVNISGGEMDISFRNAAEINISGGFVADFESHGMVDISGGSVDFFSVWEGSVLNFSGGSVGSFESYGEVNIRGGSLGSAAAREQSVFNISGGSVGDQFQARDGSEVNLLGSDFVLDGVLLDDLTEGDAFTILDRDVTLSGLLADGSAFSFDLNSVREFSQDSFDPGSTLTVTLTPQLQLGDCNLDGVVNISDISSFISMLTVGDYRFQADINGDGIVSFLDIGPFIELLSL